MRKQLQRWFFLNFLFALTPFFFVVVIRALLDQMSFTTIQQHTSEILFFAIMICVSANVDLAEALEVSDDPLLTTFNYILSFGAVVSAFLYGAFIFDFITGPVTLNFRTNLFIWAAVLAIALFFFTTVVEIFIARLRTNNEEVS